MVKDARYLKTKLETYHRLNERTLLLLEAVTASSLGLCSLLLGLWLMRRMLRDHFSDLVLVPRVSLTLVCCSGFEGSRTRWTDVGSV